MKTKKLLIIATFLITCSPIAVADGCYRSDGSIDTVLCTCVISEKVMLQGHAELYDVNK